MLEEAHLRLGEQNYNLDEKTSKNVARTLGMIERQIEEKTGKPYAKAAEPLTHEFMQLAAAHMATQRTG